MQATHASATDWHPRGRGTPRKWRMLHSSISPQTGTPGGRPAWAALTKTFGIAALMAALSANAVELRVAGAEHAASLPMAHMGVECGGRGLSPAVTWSSLPLGTRSLAVTVYSPDAPTGSGFWYWIVYDIPVHAAGLREGIRWPAPDLGDVVQHTNDSGQATYAAPCPAPGKRAQRYLFTVHALRVESIKQAHPASPAIARALIHQNRIDHKTIMLIDPK